MLQITEEAVREALKEVYDPELGISIVDLGLVYDIDIKQDGAVHLSMTLTTPACPLGPTIRAQAHRALALLPGVKEVRVDFVWSPPWDPHTMASEEGKAALGLW